MAHLEDIQQTSPNAGQIIAQAGQANLNRQQQDVQLANQLRQHREMQLLQIDAQSNLQKQAADQALKRTALQFGLDKQLKEDEFDNEMLKLQEQARLQAQMFEYRYSAQQRQEIAKFNTARQAVTSSEQFTPEEKQIALRLIDQQQANIKPSMMPRDPSKPIYPDGQGPGQMWKEQDGSVVGRKPDGSLQLIQRWDQGPDAKKFESQAKLEEKKFELQARREEKLLDIRSKIASEQVDETGPDGKKKGSRYRTAQEIDQIMQGVMGGGQQNAAQPGQSAQPQEWWQQPASKNLQITDADKNLPPIVGQAQAFIRTINAKYGGYAAVPPQFQAAYRESTEILRQAQSQN